ncbi:hypothetical protein DSUL_20087 [Desulfovibrionales bacterium]
MVVSRPFVSPFFSIRQLAVDQQLLVADMSYSEWSTLVETARTNGFATGPLGSYICPPLLYRLGLWLEIAS